MRLSKIVCCLLLSSSTILLADANKEEVALGNIVITGDKLEKNLQDSLSSVQVFDESVLVNSSSLKSMHDLFNQTSNVNSTGQGTFNIRGISNAGISPNYIGPSMTNVSVDGNSLSSISARKGAISTWDMKQVEIMKGPQSTSQGRNSLAGAIVMKTNDPEFDANGAAQISYGTNNTSQASFMQTGAINDKIALRLAIDRRHTDGFLTNDNFRDDKYNEENHTNIRGKLLYKLDNEGKILLTLSKLSQDKKGYWQSNENRENEYTVDGYHYTDGYAHSLDISLPLNNNWTFQSITSFAKEELSLKRDFNRNGSLDATYYNDRENKSIEQEFRFNYEGENSKSVIGLYYGKGTGTEDRFSEDVVTSGVLVDIDADIEEKYSNTALFFNSDYYLNDKFTLISGLRVDRDERETSSKNLATRTTSTGSTFHDGLIDNTLEGYSNQASKENDTTNIMPKLGLGYKASENINLGILYSKGYRPGGLSTNPVDGTTNDFDKETTDNFELSFKSTWLENSLIVNANVFYTKWKDQQVEEAGTSGVPLDAYVVNAGKTTSKGIELEIQAQITDQFDIYTSVGYARTKFDEYTAGTNDYSGNYLAKSPKFTANLGANYRYNRYFIGGNIEYKGTQYDGSENEDQINAYTLVNMKIGYEHDDWSLSLYSNNLFDKNYARSYDGEDVYELGEERVVGVNFKYFW